METLLPPHTHFLSAAEGWLGLGDIAEARAELAKIVPALQEHPDVLEVRWAVCAHENDWPTALVMARRLVEIAPENPAGWLHRSYAVRRVPEGGLQAAWNNLYPAIEKFPDEELIPYNLACYACQLRRLEQAIELFKRVLANGNRERIKKLALADLDLQLLWEQIREL